VAEEEVGLRLSLKNRREVVAGIHNVGDEVDRAGDKAASANRQAGLASRGFAAFGRAGRTAGRIAAVGIAAATGALVAAGYAATKLVQSSLSEAREAQKVSAVTRAEIKATGGVANVTERSMSRLAGAISRKAGMDDEAIQSGANLLLTFKNIRNETGKGNKIFDQATQAAVDLSAAGFGSIQSGSKMLGKALNDPLKGITALSKAGVTFSADQVERITNYVEENDLLAAQKVILGEVQAQVGGVAAAQATWGDKAQVTLDNVKERLGTAILPLWDKLGKWFVQTGGPQLDHFVDIFEQRGIPVIERYASLFVDKGIPAIKGFIDDARPLAESVLPAIGDGLKTARDLFGDIAPMAKTVFDGFNKLPDWAKSAIALTVGGTAIGKKLGAFDRGGLIGSIASAARPLPVLVTNPGFGAGGAGSPGGGVVAGGTKTPKGGLSKIPKGSIPATILITAALASDDVQTILSDPIGELKAELLYPWVDGPFAPGHEVSKAWKKTMAGIEANTVDGTQAMARLLGIPLKALNHDFDVLGAKKPRPSIKAPGLDESLTGGDRLVGLLNQLDHTHVQPVVDVDTSSAVAKLNAVRTALLNLPAVGSYGAGLGVNSPNPPAHHNNTSTTSSHHDWSGLNPRVNGPVSPRVADPYQVADDYFGDAVGPAQPIVVQSILDGRLVAENTVHHVDDRVARR
jgi:hypothetical protein